jgi:hypothetical protein
MSKFLIVFTEVFILLTPELLNKLISQFELKRNGDNNLIPLWVSIIDTKGFL